MRAAAGVASRVVTAEMLNDQAVWVQAGTWPGPPALSTIPG